MDDADQMTTGELALRLAEASHDDAESLVGESLRRLARRVGADRAYVTVYHDDGTFQNRFEWTEQGVVPQLPVIQRLPIADFPTSSGRARRGEVWAVPDLDAVRDTAPAEHRSFSSFGVAAVLQVPVVVDGVGVGLVGLNHFAPVPGWTPGEIDAVRDLSRAIGVALIRVRADDSTRRAEDAEVDARHARTELLAHVSHELRTPLHGLLGYAELLGLRTDLGDDRLAVSQIEASGRRLLAMVDDLIDLAESSDGRVTDVDLHPLVTAAADGLATAARQRQIVIRIDPSLVGASVRSEVGRVRQILYGVLSGAIQSVTTNATITVSADQRGPDGRAVTIAIDSGGASDPARVVLPLARTLVEGHGRIDVVDRDRGVDIRVTFDGPAAPTPSNARAEPV